MHKIGWILAGVSGVVGFVAASFGLFDDDNNLTVIPTEKQRKPKGKSLSELAGEINRLREVLGKTTFEKPQVFREETPYPYAPTLDVDADGNCIWKNYEGCVIEDLDDENPESANDEPKSVAQLLKEAKRYNKMLSEEMSIDEISDRFDKVGDKFLELLGAEETPPEQMIEDVDVLHDSIHDEIYDSLSNATKTINIIVTPNLDEAGRTVYDVDPAIETSVIHLSDSEPEDGLAEITSPTKFAEVVLKRSYEDLIKEEQSKGHSVFVTDDRFKKLIKTCE